jgi:hypothetical protein
MSSRDTWDNGFRIVGMSVAVIAAVGVLVFVIGFAGVWLLAPLVGVLQSTGTWPWPLVAYALIAGCVQLLLVIAGIRIGSLEFAKPLLDELGLLRASLTLVLIALFSIPFLAMASLIAMLWPLIAVGAALQFVFARKELYHSLAEWSARLRGVDYEPRD